LCYRQRKEVKVLRILIWTTAILLAGELFTFNLPVNGRNPSTGQIAQGGLEGIAVLFVFYGIDRFLKRKPN
jgi:hypothetical protein